MSGPGKGRRSLSVVLAATLAVSSLPAPAVFARPALPASQAGEGMADLAALDLSTLTVPASLGRVVDTWQPDGKTPRALVIHLQDLHTHPAAQRHLGELVGHVRDRLGIGLVALEGASGLCDTTLYSDFPDPPTTARIARLFLEEGLFTGAELYAITHPGAVTLWGVEDEAAYLEHLKTYQQGATRQAEAEATIARLREALLPLRKAIWPRPLFRLIDLKDAYANDAEAFKPYFQELMRVARLPRIRLEAFPHLLALERMYALYPTLDMREVEADRDRLLEALRPMLSPDEQQRLAALAKTAKDDEAATERFTLELARLAKGHEVQPLADPPWLADAKDTLRLLAAFSVGAPLRRPPYQALRRYLAYLRAFQQVRAPALTDELDALEQLLEEAAWRTKQQRILAKLLRQLQRLDELIHIHLSPSGWHQYQASRSGLTADQLAAELRLLLRQSPVTPGQLAALIDALPTHERFYELAHRRDEALVRNTLALLDRRAPSPQPRATMLIAGGFHTPAITARLKAQDVAYAVISPAADGAFDETRYRERLQVTLPPIEELLRKLDAMALQTVISSDPDTPVFIGEAGEPPVIGAPDQPEDTRRPTVHDATLAKYVASYLHDLAKRGHDRLEPFIAWAQRNPHLVQAGIALAYVGGKIILTAATGAALQFDASDGTLLAMGPIISGMSGRTDGEAGSVRQPTEELGRSALAKEGFWQAGLVDHRVQQPAVVLSVLDVHRHLEAGPLPELVGPALGGGAESVGSQDADELSLAKNELPHAPSGASARGARQTPPSVGQADGSDATTPPGTGRGSSQDRPPTRPAGERAQPNSPASATPSTPQYLPPATPSQPLTSPRDHRGPARGRTPGRSRLPDERSSAGRSGTYGTSDSPSTSVALKQEPVKPQQRQAASGITPLRVGSSGRTSGQYKELILPLVGFGAVVHGVALLNPWLGWAVLGAGTLLSGVLIYRWMFGTPHWLQELWGRFRRPAPPWRGRLAGFLKPLLEPVPSSRVFQVVTLTVLLALQPLGAPFLILAGLKRVDAPTAERLERVARLHGQVRAKQAEFTAAAKAAGPRSGAFKDRRRAMKGFRRISAIARGLATSPKLFDQYMTGLAEPLLRYNGQETNAILSTELEEAFERMSHLARRPGRHKVERLGRHLEEALASVPRWKGASTCTYLAEFPILVQAEGITEPERAKLDEAARLIRASGWKRPLQHIRLIIARPGIWKAAGLSHVHQPGHRIEVEVGMRLTQRSAAGLAATLIHEDTHHALADDPHWSPFRDPMWTQPLRHPWLARGGEPPSGLLAEHRCYLRESQFIAQLFSKELGDPVRDHDLTWQLFAIQRKGWRAVHALAGSINAGELSLSGRRRLRYTERLQRRRDPQITAAWGAMLRALLQSPDPGLRTQGLWYAAAAWNEDRQVPGLRPKSTYRRRFRDALQQETQPEVLQTVVSRLYNLPVELTREVEARLEALENTRRDPHGRRKPRVGWTGSRQIEGRMEEADQLMHAQRYAEALPIWQELLGILEEFHPLKGELDRLPPEAPLPAALAVRVQDFHERYGDQTNLDADSYDGYRLHVETQLAQARAAAPPAAGAAFEMAAPVDSRSPLPDDAPAANALIRVGYLDRVAEHSIGLTEDRDRRAELAISEEDLGQLQADPPQTLSRTLTVAGTSYRLTLVWEHTAVRPGLNVRSLDGPAGREVFLNGMWQRFEPTTAAPPVLGGGMTPARPEPEEVKGVQGDQPASEPVPFTHVQLVMGFQGEWQGQPAHIRGIAPVSRIVRNYLAALRVRTPDGRRVIPRVFRVYVPRTRLDMPQSKARGDVVVQERSESQLPAETLALLRQARDEGLCEVVELQEEAEYREAARALRLNEQEFFTTLIQVRSPLPRYCPLVFVSDWVGPSVQEFLWTHDTDPTRLWNVGVRLGETLLAIHRARLICGNTHLRQFVVRGAAEEILRVDLGDIYSLDEARVENIASEHMAIREGLVHHTAAIQGFLHAYPPPEGGGGGPGREEPAPGATRPEPQEDARTEPPAPPADPSALRDGLLARMETAVIPPPLDLTVPAAEHDRAMWQRLITVYDTLLELLRIQGLFEGQTLLIPGSGVDAFPARVVPTIGIEWEPLAGAALDLAAHVTGQARAVYAENFRMYPGNALAPRSYPDVQTPPSDRVL